MMYDLASESDFLLAPPSAPGLSIGCIADNHVTMKKDERLIHKFEGLQAESIVARWGGEEYHCVIHGAPDERENEIL